MASVPEQFYKYYFTANTTPQDNYDYDAAGNLIYQGMAQVGIANNSAGWIITKYVYQLVTINSLQVYQLIHDSTLVNVTWSLRTVYNYP